MNSWIWRRREDSNCASQLFHDLRRLFDSSKVIMIRSHYRLLRAGVESVLGLQAGSSPRTMVVAKGQRLASPGPAKRHRIHARVRLFESPNKGRHGKVGVAADVENECRFAHVAMKIGERIDPRHRGLKSLADGVVVLPCCQGEKMLSQYRCISVLPTRPVAAWA